jgi:hypothetical protein
MILLVMGMMGSGQFHVELLIMLLMMVMVGSGTVPCITSEEVIGDGND